MNNGLVVCNFSEQHKVYKMKEKSNTVAEFVEKKMLYMKTEYGVSCPYCRMQKRVRSNSFFVRATQFLLVDFQLSGQVRQILSRCDSPNEYSSASHLNEVFFLDFKGDRTLVISCIF